MLDIDLLVQQLRNRGHKVDSVIPVPENAGDFEFLIDGKLLTLSDVRGTLEQDQNRPIH
jgi:hypothetical protein